MELGLTIDPPPPGTPEWTSAVGRLHEALKHSEYEVCQWIPTQKRFLAAVFEPVTLWRYATGSRQQFMDATAAPLLYRRLTRIKHPVAERCLSFFGLEAALPDSEVSNLLALLGNPLTLAELLELRLASRAADGRLESRLRFIPHGELLFVADRYDRTIPNFSYLGRDSVRMAEWQSRVLKGRRFGRGLDICCGTGIQGITLSCFADQVEGVDINPRAVAFANLNAQLNGLQNRIQFAQGNLAIEKQGPYDIVVSNPPYVFMPAEDAKSNRDGFGGGDLGLEIVGKIVCDLDRLLGKDGESHLVLTSPVVNGKSMLEPLLEDRLANCNLGALVTYLDYRFEAVYSAYHRAHGISHVINCYLQIGRNLPRGVKVAGLSPVSRLANRLYVEFASLKSR